MIVYCDSRGVICDVGKNTTGDDTLIETYINDDENPFSGWSRGKICCYRVNVVDGQVVMMTPAVDSRLIRNFDTVGREVDTVTPTVLTKKAYIGDTSVTFYEVPTGNVTVYIGGYSGNYTVNRVQDRLTVEFEPLEEVTEVTISII